jgi:hypothetical protein
MIEHVLMIMAAAVCDLIVLFHAHKILKIIGAYNEE